MNTPSETSVAFGTQLLDLSGRRAIVSGGAGELGLALVEVLHRCGAEVVILDASAKTAETAATAGRLHGAGRPVHGIQIDLADRSQAGSAFDEAVDRMGGLDILVNAAGIQRRSAAIDFSEQDWDDVLAVNLSATFFLCQRAARILLPQGRGKVVNIASMTSFVGMKFVSAYAASKAGVMQLTKALSNEWAGDGVQVNAIAPGYFKTRMNAAYFEPAHAELYRGITQRIPAARWGEPSDLQGALVFLASSASDYVSGVTLPVDGGFLGR